MIPSICIVRLGCDIKFGRSKGIALESSGKDRESGQLINCSGRATTTG